MCKWYKAECCVRKLQTETQIKDTRSIDFYDFYFINFYGKMPSKKKKDPVNVG